MCGIAGIWYLDGKELSYNSLQIFTDSIKHRGPDGSGYNLIDNNMLGFGHRRLSILDLSEVAKQPMFNWDKSLVISYNGEVYNFLEIREELEFLGFKFHTDSDTEVILNAYKKWGIDCLNKFNGMFAIALWDVNSKELILVRDRFGVKPLYFLYLPGQLFAFCSETLGFKHLEGYQRNINANHFNIEINSPEILEGSNKTIFNNIFQLLPGHFLKMRKNDEPAVKQWWSTEKSLREVPSSYTAQVEEFTALFESACKLRMRSDVPLASALSGGLDSSSVYSTLHKLNSTHLTIERLSPKWQQAFVATFPDTAVDEKRYADLVVKHVNGSAHYITPDYSNLVGDIVKATRLLDGIISTPITCISDIYKSMRENGVTVSMDGHGVDEMMYGYSNYVSEAFYDALYKKQFFKAQDYAKVLVGLSPNYKIEDLEKKIKHFDRTIFERGASFIKRKLIGSSTAQFSALKLKWFDDINAETVSSIISEQTSPAGWSNSEKLMYNDFHYRSLPINLRDFDRAAMQHGVEIRMPFMDYRLVTYVFSLPIESKIGGGFTKRILRDAMKNTLPETIRQRTLKIGIGAPMEEWFNRNLKEFIMDTVRMETFQSSVYWNGKLISKDIAAAYKNNTLTKNFCSTAWRAINAQIILNEN